MKNFNKYLRNKAKEEKIEIPNSVKGKIERTLSALPEKEEKSKRFKNFKFAPIIAAFAFLTIVLLPNLSPAYARALEHIPVIGDIVRVVTVRNYFYSDDNHEMNVNVPELENENSEAIDSINADIKELTDAIINRFYKDLETIGDSGHSSVYVDYETLTNTDYWFTLKLLVYEVAGSGNTYYKYYHFNKTSETTVTLGDIAENSNFYNIVEEDIKRQMTEAMKADNSLTYWVQDSVFGENIVSINAEHNFYFNEEYDLVIPFDKYEVAPGYMGTPEFTVKKDVIKDVVKDEFKDIFTQ